MSQRQITIAIVAILLLITGALLVFGKWENRYSWWEHYRTQSKDPYGLYIFQNLLKEYFPGESFKVIRADLSKELPAEGTGMNYVFHGAWLSLDSAQTEALMGFVKRGNRALLLCPNLPDALLDSISGEQCLTFSPLPYLEEGDTATGEYVYNPLTKEWVWQDSVTFDSLAEYTSDDSLQTEPFFKDSLHDEAFTEDTTDLNGDSFTAETDSISPNDGAHIEDTLVRLNLTHPFLKDKEGYLFEFRIKNRPETYSWNYLPPDLFCDSQTVFAKLGVLNDTAVNFAKATYGGGEFLLHTTPIAFTNLYLKERRGVEYAEKVFSHLSPGDIYWEQTRFIMPEFGRNRQLAGEGPLKYILSQPPLAWAWYILLAMGLLFLVFRAKRRQRIIPVIEPNANTSLEFIETIGRLYFIQNNHKQLALQKMKLFLGFVRERYGVSTKELDSAFVRHLSLKSQLPENLLENVLLLHRNIENSGFVSENTLVNFHQLLERFYKECK
jgi:hypothetical protein